MILPGRPEKIVSVGMAKVVDDESIVCGCKPRGEREWWYARVCLPLRTLVLPTVAYLTTKSAPLVTCGAAVAGLVWLVVRQQLECRGLRERAWWDRRPHALALGAIALAAAARAPGLCAVIAIADAVYSWSVYLGCACPE